MKIVLAWLYNRRSELVGATGTQTRPYDYEYSYDSIGNRLTSSDNFGTSTYAANCLNQYTAVNRTIDQSQQLVLRSFSEGGSNNFTYDADGNLTQDDRFTYTYDDENRLVSVTPLNPQLGSCAIDNAYDHRSRRIRKVVKHYDGTSWNTAETHVFVWDGWNIVLEKITFADNTTRTIEYFWANDLSGSEQGAGGVGGLLAKRIDGVFYVPVYGGNGNIMMYVSESGSIAAQYDYDPYGNILQATGPLASQFAFGFSTKYHDREVGLVAYQLRTYDPVNGRWLNRDPIEEEGGINIYQFVNNTPNSNVDNFGLYLVPLIDPIVKQKMNETDDVANPKKQRAAAKFIDMYNVHQYFLAYKEFEEQFNNARSKLLRCCSRRGLKRNKICKLISDGHLQVYVVFRLVTKTNLDFANGSIFSVKGGNPGESVAKGIALLDMYDPGNGSAVPIFEYYDRFANIHGESLETLMFHELTHYNQLKLNGDHSAEKWFNADDPRSLRRWNNWAEYEAIKQENCLRRCCPEIVDRTLRGWYYRPSTIKNPPSIWFR